MTDLSTARERVKAYLLRMERRINGFGSALPGYQDPRHRLVIVKESEYDFGWVFCYNTEQYVATGDARNALASFEIGKTGDPGIQKVEAKWRPDSTKVAIRLQYRRWSEILVYVRVGDAFKLVEFAAPDPSALYEKKVPKGFPKAIRRIGGPGCDLGEWITNESIRLVAVDCVENYDDPKHASGKAESYSIKVNYHLKIEDGHGSVLNQNLSCTPQ